VGIVVYRFRKTSSEGQNESEELMKRLFARAALAAGVVGAVAATSNRVEALPFGAPAGLVQPVNDVAQIKQVYDYRRWRHHNCYRYWGTGYFPSEGYFWPHGVPWACRS
jgi:hypothetical protein